MAITAGSVTVDDEGEHTGSGLALDMYEAFPVGSANYTAWQGLDDAAVLKVFAEICNGWADAIADAVNAEL